MRGDVAFRRLRQISRRAGGKQYLLGFGSYPLDRDRRKPFGRGGGFECGAVYGKSKLCGKPEGAQNAQGVLGKASLGVAHAADHTCFKVGLPVPRVAKPAHGGVCHCVHGKIASGKILLDPVGELHAVGVS